ncbi:hypothetical protein [Streptomyces sp. NPDC058629]|uniref:hypothetical protein n=1 Tax=Streptomyces sp. NPDC058629 TaxID=3346565 RepID=UPI00365F3D25
MVTDHSGRQYLLRAAKPTDHRGDELLDPETDAVVYGDLEFRDQREGETYSWMRSGNSLAVGRTEYDPDAIVGVANPIARWVEKSAQHTTDLLAEVDRLRTELAQRNKDLEPYEALNPQQCPAGQHADWLVDSEYTHACPWCRIAELEAQAADSNGVTSALTVIVKHGDMSDEVRREIRDLLPSQREAGAL